MVKSKQAKLEPTGMEEANSRNVGEQFDQRYIHEER